MGWTTAAILAGTAISAMASKSAADAQSDAAAQAGQVSERQYRQTREDLAPYRGAGGAAINELSALYGLPLEGGYPTINQDGTIDDSTPNTGNALIDRILARNPGLADRFGGFTGQQEAIPNSGTMNALAPNMARFGRNGDTEMAHLTPGETVVPREMMRNPSVRNALAEGFTSMGMDPGRYTVGGSDDSINPVTGAREYYSASGSANPGDEAGGWGESGGFGAGDFGGNSGDYGGGPESQNAGGRDNDPMDRNNLFRGGGLMDRFMRNNAQVAATGPMTAPADSYYSQDAAIERFYQSPDYRLAFDEGQAALERSAAARGGLFSGNTGVALTKYGQQLGGNLYGNYYNRLANLAGLGQNAAAQTGNYGAQAAANQGNALIAGGNAQAAGYTGIGSAINSGVGNYLLYDYLRQ